MTVKELKELIEEYPDDWLVILAQDEEGNYYKPAYTIDSAHWDSEEL